MSAHHPRSASRDELLALLEETPPLVDDGFSERVARALPARRSRRLRALPYALVAASAPAACALVAALGWGPVSRQLAHVSGGAGHGSPLGGPVAAMLLALGIVAATAVSTAED